MGKVWEFFENLNDVVYVSDMDSHELIYMNKRALDLFGLSSLEELAGKKCYEFLHGSNFPCAICNNDALEEKQFQEWKYYNPILNRHYILKDTMIMDDGRRCRVELAIDNSVQEQRDQMYLEQQNLEMIANEGMRLALSAETPDKALNIFLEYLGNALHAERIYIFEKNKSGGDDNTYEWVASGVTPEIDHLQNLPPEVCADWYDRFSEEKSVVIEDIERIRENDPVKYQILKDQNIHSLVVTPLYYDTEVIGFYGVDNPQGKTFEYTQNILGLVAHFIVSCLKRRNLLRQLEEMSYRDPLTKLGNRFAMDRYMDACTQELSLGVVYCDVTGLKKVNDTEGHMEGDRLLLRASESLQQVFGKYGRFRIGGDEFLVLCPGIEREEFLNKTSELKQVALEQSAVLAVGSVWHERKEADIDVLLKEAERLMYEDKSYYYKNAGMDRREF